MSKHSAILQVSTLALVALALSAGAALADDANADVAKQLQNPVADLISVPIQNNFDFGGGPVGGRFQYKLNIQPVIPVSISDDWNLITRVILPVVEQSDAIGWTSQFGLSDTTLSLFLSPKAPTSDGWIWGAGPVLLLPTATDGLLGTEKWGAGPTAVALKQEDGWTYGALVNHIWSFAGNSGRANVNATFIEPFFNYTTQDLTTFGIETESSYDWHNARWTVPLNLLVSQLVELGGKPVSFQLGARYYAEKPDSGPSWGLRFEVTLLFPK
jgi:hypothetical protein